MSGKKSAYLLDARLSVVRKTFHRPQFCGSIFGQVVVCSRYELWLPEDHGVLSRVYVSRTRVCWHEEIAKLKS